MLLLELLILSMKDKVYALDIYYELVDYYTIATS